MAHNEPYIKVAATCILSGGLVAMPTETVYGLAADATDDKAVARIFKAKGRPQFNPLIAHISGAEMAARFAVFSPLAKRLADAFWPGALTLVLPRQETCAISLLASAGLDTVALRAPNHPIAQSLIKTVDRPLAAPSANPSGFVSPTTAEHVRAGLGDKIDMVLDGDACVIGLESTIVKVDGDNVQLLRPGGIAREAIEKIIDKKLQDAEASDKPQAPGMLTSHYATNVPLRLNASAPQEGEAFLSFGDTNVESQHALNLSPTGDMTEAAANLFSYLRKLDTECAAHGLSGIAAASIPQTDLGEAINDRLKRAAAPR